MKFPVRPALPNTIMGSDAHLIRPSSTYKSGNVVQTTGATSASIIHTPDAQGVLVHSYQLSIGSTPSPAVGGNDIIEGGIGDDIVFAGGGDDQVEGGDGADVVFGDGGKDIIQGGIGNDILYGMTSSSAVMAWTSWTVARATTPTSALPAKTASSTKGNTTISLAAADGLGATGLSTSTFTNADGGTGLQLDIALDTGETLKIQSAFFGGSGSGLDTIIESAGDQSLLIQTKGGVLFSFFWKSSANDSIYKNSFERKAA